MAELIYIPSFLVEDIPDESSLYSGIMTASDSDEITCTRESCGSDSSCTMYGGCDNYCYDCNECDDCEDIVIPPPGKGRIIEVTSTQDSITVEFRSISTAIGYTVLCREVDGDFEKTVDTTKTSCTITGLELDTEYAVSYWGYNEGGEGPASAEVVISTKGLGGYIWVYHQHAWREAYPYIYIGGSWKKYSAHVFASNDWRLTM